LFYAIENYLASILEKEYTNPKNINTMKNKIKSSKKIMLLFVACIICSNTAFSQIDCGSPSGILALMVGPVALNPTDADNILNTTTMSVRCTTRMFLNPPTTISKLCESAIQMRVFYSRNENDLKSLPSLATSNMQTLLAKPNVLATVAVNTPVINDRPCNATIPSSTASSGQIVYYRWAKIINHPTDVDPVVWSTILQVTKPTPPLANVCTTPNLKPAPANSNDITVFKTIGGSWSDAASHTYIQISGVWCKDFFNSSGQVVSGTSAGSDASIGPMRQMTISLPPITWGVVETNNRAVNTAFSNSLFRSGESAAIATFNVPNMAAGATVNAPPFTNRGTRTVYLFTQQNNACAVKTFDASQGNLNVEEKNYIVKVDTGNTVTECVETSTDNSKTYSNAGGTQVVFPR